MTEKIFSQILWAEALLRNPTFRQMAEVPFH